MERNALFREILALNENLKTTFESELSFEFSEQDIAKYQDLLKPRIKTNKDPQKLTNLIFYNQLHPELKGRKLKDTDKEQLKNDWTNIYYQIVLPLLGHKNKQPQKFNYSDELRARIEGVGDKLSKIYDIISAIKIKSPSAVEFDNNLEVLKGRTNANQTLQELLIPLLIEGLNLNKPEDIYKALVTLNEGRLIDTFVDIMAHNPALLPAESRKRYESKKLFIIKTLKNTIKFYLEKRSPSDVQTGVEPKGSRNENVEAKRQPDNAKYNLTGKFEYVNKVDLQQPLGMVICLNQAGNWIEGVLSIVGSPQKFTDNPKFFYRFYTEIKDWTKPNPMIFIRGNLEAFKVNIKLLVLNADTIQIIVNQGPVNFKRISGEPILTERHLAMFKDNPLARQTQWFPLLTSQQANIKSYFKNFTSYRPILSYAKYNNTKGQRNRFLNVKNLIASAIKGDSDPLELLAGGLDQFIDENIHKSDRDIAAFYMRQYLNQTSFEKTGWKLTLLSWLYRQLKISKKYDYRNFFKFIYGGNASGDKITPVGNQLYQYKIDVDVSGFGVGYFIKGGYYRGKITIRCEQWEALGVKNPDGSTEAVLKLQMGEFGGGVIASLNFGQSFGGVAESDVLWMPDDFVGLFSIMKADAEIGQNITKIGKKLGISAGIGATIGLMEIVGDSNLPPLYFGIYSLSGVVGGVEPKPKQQEIDNEAKVGREVAASVVIGSIWKNGPLPAPKDVIKYGNEETVLKATYKGDGKAHFKHDSALLTPGAENLIRKLCANEMFLLILPNTHIEIIGHTDMSGTDKYNEGLSKNRANNVKKKIIDICGNKINAMIDKPSYKGAELAKKDPDKSKYNPKYRRVDIVINGLLVLSLVGL